MEMSPSTQGILVLGMGGGAITVRENEKKIRKSIRLDMGTVVRTQMGFRTPLRIDSLSRRNEALEEIKRL